MICQKITGIAKAEANHLANKYTREYNRRMREIRKNIHETKKSYFLKSIGEKTDKFISCSSYIWDKRSSGTGRWQELEDVSLMYTGIMKKGDKKIVRVRFTRNGEKDFAEGIVPGGKIENSKGFTEKELASLRFFLKANEDEIYKKAKEITGFRGYFRS